MTLTLFLIAYGIAAFRTARMIASALYADLHRPDTEGQVLCAVVGLLLGIIWPLVLLAMGLRYAFFGPAVKR